MIYRLLADLVVILHFLFILFVVFGGLLAFRWPRIAWIHLPAAIWGAIIEVAGWICPLTPLENWLRQKGGQSGYTGGFIDHYLLGLIYPTGLTRGTQLILALVVIGINVVIYALVAKQK